METLFCISIALGAGLLMSRVVKPLGLPSVTGYLVAGILIGPYAIGALGFEGMGFTSVENVKEYQIISDASMTISSVVFSSPIGRFLRYFCKCSHIIGTPTTVLPALLQMPISPSRFFSSAILFLCLRNALLHPIVYLLGELYLENILYSL